MATKDLRAAEGHFAFGKNWASYAALIGEAEIEEARKGLTGLIPADQFAGRSFLDIGCGSGVHALAAASLGVSRMFAVDIDPDSVVTTRQVLTRHGAAAPWQVETISVFDLDPAVQGQFDIVYSWGVLHHTGSMWEAVGRAAAMVAPGGLLAIALYRPTRLDPLWKLEKRLYSRAPRPVQRAVHAAYVGAFRIGKLATGASFRDYVASYRSARGMDFHHDVHDWLGGYPYESAGAGEVDRFLKRLGFAMERRAIRPPGFGLFGSGCDEYVYRRPGRA